METKMSSSCSRTTVRGCRRPTGGMRPGRVTSTRSRSSRSSRRRVSSSARRASRRDSTSCLTVLSSRPASRRCSSFSFPSRPKSSVSSPDLRPRNRVRTSCRPSGSRTSASAVSKSCRSRGRSRTMPSAGRSEPGMDGRRLGRSLRRPGRLHERSEGRRIGGGDLGERLPVQPDPGPLQPRDELAVGDVVHPGGGVDADDPEPAEVPLLAAPPDVGEVARPLDGLLGGAIELAFGEEVSLGQPQDLLPAVPALAPSLDSRHDDVPSMAGPAWARPSRLQAATKPGRLDSPPLLFNAESAEARREERIKRLRPLRDSAISAFKKAILAQQHPPDVRCLARRHQGGSAQVPFPARGLLGQDVALERVEALHLAGGGELETLHGAPPALQLQPLLGLSHFSSLSEPPRTTAAAARAGRGSLGSLGPLGALGSLASCLPPLPPLGFGGAASFLGDRIWTMVMPSWRGGTSMRATSVSSLASRFRIPRPISLCTISRPRKMTVDFTLFPPRRKRSAFRRLNWKSCSSILGRNFTSLTWMCFWCLRASDSRLACW